MALAPRRLANSQLTNAAATYYTSSGVRTRIDALTLTNTDTVGHTFSVWLVPSAGTADNTNIVVKARTIAAGGSTRLLEAIGHVMEVGGTLQASADAGSVVTLVASGIQQTDA